MESMLQALYVKFENMVGESVSEKKRKKKTYDI